MRSHAPVGWRGESHRHYLASRGISTATRRYDALLMNPLSDFEVRQRTGLARKCPMCGGLLGAHPALSRRDNSTEVCSACGTREAMDDYFRTHKRYKADKMVTFTPEKTRRLQKRYNLAVANGEEKFTFEGDEYLTAYAKYLLQYLKMREEGR